MEQGTRKVFNIMTLIRVTLTVLLLGREDAVLIA
jgi:hypothetical protein